MTTPRSDILKGLLSPEDRERIARLHAEAKAIVVRASVVNQRSHQHAETIREVLVEALLIQRPVSVALQGELLRIFRDTRARG